MLELPEVTERLESLRAARSQAPEKFSPPPVVTESKTVVANAEPAPAPAAPPAPSLDFPAPALETDPAAIAEPTATEPPPEPTKENPLELERDISFSRFSVMGGGSFHTLSGREKSSGRQARLISHFSPSVRVGWEQIWSPHWSSQLSCAGESVSIAPLATHSIENSNNFLSTLSASATYYGGEQLSIQFALSQQDFLLHRALSSSALTMEKSQKTVVSARAEERIAQAKQMELKAVLEGGAILPGNSNGYQTSTGFEFEAGLKISHHSQNKSGVDATLFYQQSSLSTGTVKFSEQEVGVRLGYTWTWGAP